MRDMPMVHQTEIVPVGERPNQQRRMVRTVQKEWRPVWTLKTLEEALLIAHSIPRPFAEAIPAGRYNQARIFAALCERPYGISMRELVDVVYGHDPDGGPDAAPNCIHTLIGNMREHLKKVYPMLRIENRQRRYMLVLKRS